MFSVMGGGEIDRFVIQFFAWFVVYYWGCAKVSGRGTLYMKWGQENLRFATMRLRGEKRKKKI